MAQLLDPAVARALSLGPDTAASVSRHGGSGFSTTAKIMATYGDGGRKDFFMKTAPGSDAEIMFRGEHASLNAIHAVIPSLCPQSFGHGVLEKDAQSSHRTAFLVTEYLDFGARVAAASDGTKDLHGSSGLSLAAKLGKLHSTPAPIPDGFATPVFGFPDATCCGDTIQANEYKESWADFYAHNRLRAIIRQYEHAHGKDAELRSLVEDVADTIVPRLLRDDHHSDNGNKIMPVIVHGDLWSGNKGTGIIGGQGGLEEVVFDPSACYASREYEWGIMKMFGGFDRDFEREYHTICPKMEPVEEYNDRIRLYELYHHLNHATIFGNSYRSGAISIIRELQRRYGNKK
ncbi:1-phosphatidylinositol-3-phosphate 5-kinase [Pseudocyphellaria aurata]|nr:1-phosphatidylinositol-3-phosphate 5-kinase [Pseudocyphellaria aurata]